MAGEQRTSDGHTGHTWLRPMRARDTGQAHRAATPLELLFDLCFVVAVALAAAQLHHAVAEDHILEAILGYVPVFFAIWWAWMNFTWFASAYDTDDGPYRLATLVQIAGVLILASGVPRAFERGDYTIVVLGYVVMRLALIAQWLRAAAGNPDGRTTALRYAGGIAVVQLGWVALLAVPAGWRLGGWLVLALCELLVPLWAERAARTPWHPGHIAERFGLFTLIVLGESILAATTAIQTAGAAGGVGGELLLVAASGLAIVFAMWWLYFDRPAEGLLTSRRMAFLWGYGHLPIFASAAAVGAGLQVLTDQVTGAAHLPSWVANASVAVPVAIYLLGIWAMQVRLHHRGPLLTIAYPLAALLILAATATPVALPLMVALLAALVAAAVISTLRERTAPAAEHHEPHAVEAGRRR